jgi:SAM-dependent methyltransferase
MPTVRELKMEISHKMPDNRAIKDYLRRKHPDVFERLKRANGLRSKWLLEIRSRVTPLTKNWFPLKRKRASNDRTPLDNDGLIDVKEIIAKFRPEEHVARADSYFAGFTETSSTLRKPFADTLEAADIMAGLSVLFKTLDLFPGARVLDFGCGTGWLSKILAYLGCVPIAIDLSKNAIDLGRRIAEKDPLLQAGSIDFLTYDSISIPLPDCDVDRICCFDSFHHVADQERTLAEFLRVLKPGGIAAFHEPGPNHSRSAQSQYEMRNYRVIENDIIIEAIAEAAKKVGFADIAVAYFMSDPIITDLDNFNRITRNKSRSAAQEIISKTNKAMENRRVFFLYKAGTLIYDSRFKNGLSGSLSIKVESQGAKFLTGTASCRNTGRNVWLPSGTTVGSMYLGVHLMSSDDQLIQLDYARYPILESALSPGESRTISFRVPVPDLDQYKLVFDLVAEGVCWFALLGTPPQTFAFTSKTRTLE